MTTLSVVINVYNEAHLLEECLQSIAWADEIVVTDMCSTDNSAEIYSRYTDKAILIPHRPVVELVSNIGIAEATSEWVLKLDPDERVTPALARQIQELISSSSSYAAYRLPLKDFIFGKWIRYTGWQGNREIGLIRLFQRNCVTWRAEVHSQPVIDGKVGTIHYDEALDNAIDHINYTSVSQFIEKLNRYTSAEAEKRLADGKTFRWPKLLYHPMIDFWRRFVSGKGYRDGMHGFILSILMAFYAELILIKMWESMLDVNKKSIE